MPIDQIEDGQAAEPSPIHRLPNEILCDIFLKTTVRDTNDEHPHDPCATLLAVNLVCRRWLEVTSNYPMLWSHIIDYENHRPSFIDALLRRSKTSLLDVGGDSALKAVRLRDPRATIVLDLIFQHKTSIRTLSLDIRLSPWEFICQNLLKYPAPNLEYLNLVTSCPFPDCLYAGALFAGEAPCLRRLHLQRCLIDFSSNVLHNLTELSILDIVPPEILSLRAPDNLLRIAPTVPGWLRVLKDMPSLRYLTLSGAISSPRGSEIDGEPSFRVNLSNLVFLTVGAKFHDAANFLQRLDIPSSCGIRTRLSCNKAEPGAARNKILSSLGRQVSSWSQDTQDRYLQAKILSGDRIHFGNSGRIGWIWDKTEEDLIREHSLISADPLVWQVIGFDNSEDALDFFKMLLFLYEPTFATTTRLDLWIDEEFATINNNAISFPSLNGFHSFTALETLDLLGQSPLYLLPLFQCSSSPSRPLFPSLRAMRLTKTNFEDDRRAAYFTIIAFLLWRVDVHAPLAELQIIDGKINKDTEENLRRVGNVHVSLGSHTSLPGSYWSVFQQI